MSRLLPQGQVVAAVLLVGGVLAASCALGVIVQSSVATQLAWQKRMHKQVSRLKHHTIVCGLGRMGLSVSKRLAGREVRLFLIWKAAPRIAFPL